MSKKINIVEGNKIKIISLYEKILKNELYKRPIDYKKIVYYGVKLTNALSSFENKKNTINEVNKKIINTAHLTLYFFKKLTPNEVYEIFPTKKEYDGKKYECKDWYYIQEKKEEISLNEPLEDFVFDFLWDYTYNSHIISFLAVYCTNIDKIRIAKGKKGILESFFETIDIPIEKTKTTIKIKKENPFLIVK